MVAVVLGGALAGAGARHAPAAEVAPDAPAVSEISRYCQVCWRNARLHPDLWADCTQEVFARLLERVAPAQWSQVFQADGQERREFIRAIDAVKKRSQRARKNAGLADDVADHRGAGESNRQDRLEQLEQASRAVLSPRQRRIVQLAADGWSIPDVAAELNTTVERVSDEKYKAIRKLQRHVGVAESA
jgi:RNA polymerase sigma factor (sigma-70 family)